MPDPFAEWLAAKQASGADPELVGVVQRLSDGLGFYADSHHVGFHKWEDGEVYELATDNGQEAAAVQADVNDFLGISL